MADTIGGPSFETVNAYLKQSEAVHRELGKLANVTAPLLNAMGEGPLSKLPSAVFDRIRELQDAMRPLDSLLSKRDS